MMNWQLEALAHAKKEAPSEACGLVLCIKGKKIYKPCKNISTTPKDHFILCPTDWAEAEDSGEILAVFHSHTILGPEPTPADLSSCEKLKKTWYICNPYTEEWKTVMPTKWISPLYGRTWIWGVHDCWTLVQDWYKQERGIVLRDWNRPADPEEFRLNPYFDKCFEETGFRELKENEPLRYGDSIFFSLNSKGLNHMGVFLNDCVAHHVQGRLSSRDIYGEYLLKCTGKRLRYVENN